jgi:hypothetical protein
MAASSVTAVQHVLDRKVDINAHGLSRNLDSISKRGHRPMCPAASAILGNVLVSALRAVVDSAIVAPREGIRDLQVHVLGLRGSDVLSLNSSGIFLGASPNFIETLLCIARNERTNSDNRLQHLK